MKKFYIGIEENGETLWKALNEEYKKNEYNSIIHKWYEDQIEATIKDEGYREEYMPKHNYYVYIQIGKKKRELHINEVRAGNKKQAINKCRKEIKNEFKGLKYRIIAKHRNPEDNMTEQRFEEMVNEQIWQDNPADMIDDVKDDKQVADFFGISSEIVGYENHSGECVDKKDAIGFCSGCEEPLQKKDLFNYNEELIKSYPEDEREREDIGVCPNCGEFIKIEEIKDKEVELLVTI